MVCPVCTELQKSLNDIEIGNLEHMHLYYMSPHLLDARNHCYECIESALTDLYNFAALQEYIASFQDTKQQTKLQENLEQTAHQTELENHPLCKNSGYTWKDTQMTFPSSVDIKLKMSLSSNHYLWKSYRNMITILLPIVLASFTVYLKKSSVWILLQ